MLEVAGKEMAGRIRGGGGRGRSGKISTSSLAPFIAALRAMSMISCRHGTWVRQTQNARFLKLERGTGDSWKVKGEKPATWHDTGETTGELEISSGGIWQG